MTATAIETPGLEVITVQLAAIHPNPWNPNKMNSRVYEAERESIREYGFIDPITVRPHPVKDGVLVGLLSESGGETTDDAWQILDGEHRQRAAGDEGLTSVPVTPLRTLTDAQAMKLTVILNETRGDADVVLLGKLLTELHALDDQAALLGLPYSNDELAHLMALGAAQWDEFPLADEPPPVAPPTTGELVLLYTEAQRLEIDQWLKIIAKERKTNGVSETVYEAIKAAALQAHQGT